MWMREALAQVLDSLCCIETEEVVEPSFNRIIVAISDRLIQLYFFQLTTDQLLILVWLVEVLTRLPFELRNKLEGKRSSSAFVSVDSRRENDHIRSKQLLNKSDGDGSCFVDNKKLSLSQLGIILRSDVLNSLSMVSENVDSDHCMVEFRVSALQDFIVLVLFVIHGI